MRMLTAVDEKQQNGCGSGSAKVFLQKVGYGQAQLILHTVKLRVLAALSTKSKY